MAKARSEPSAVELAYIVKGNRNITVRMLEAIEGSRREIVTIVSNEELWKGLHDALAQAKKKRVKIRIGITPSLRDVQGLDYFGDVRTSSCECNIMIVDSEKLVTASDVGTDNAYAIVTSDETMIRMSREYYDNPNCCGRN